MVSVCLSALWEEGASSGLSAQVCMCGVKYMLTGAAHMCKNNEHGNNSLGQMRPFRMATLPTGRCQMTHAFILTSIT